MTAGGGGLGAARVDGRVGILLLLLTCDEMFPLALLKDDDAGDPFKLDPEPEPETDRTAKGRGVGNDHYKCTI